MTMAASTTQPAGSTRPQQVSVRELLAIVAVYALVLAPLAAIGGQSSEVTWGLGFLLLVGLFVGAAQLFLFRGNSPMVASGLTGMVVGLSFGGTYAFFDYGLASCGGVQLVTAASTFCGGYCGVLFGAVLYSVRYCVARWEGRTLELPFTETSEALRKSATKRDRLIHFVFFAIAAVLALAVAAAMWETPNGMNVSLREVGSRLGNLPPEATNVSYSVPVASPYRAYEFSIDEEGFLRWAAQNDWPVEMTTGSVPRHPGAPTKSAAVDGYYYGWSKVDGGEYVGWDRKTERAYYFSHSR